MIGVTWTGWDGSFWDLRTGPVRLTDDGIEGLGMLDFEAFERETALVDGQVLTGWRGKARKLLFPVLIGQSINEQAWLKLDRAWWKTMRPDKFGTLTVTAPDGSSRHIRARFKSDGGMSLRRDPSAHRLTVAPIVLTADDPWWRSTVPPQRFENGSAGSNFFGGASGKGPLFRIGRANTSANATLANPGDVPAYADYTLRAPLTAFAATLDGKTVGGPIEVTGGQILLVETKPSRQVVWLIDGDTRTNVTRQLSSWEFAPIPEGEEVTFDLILTGTGSLTVELEPQFFKAW